MYQAALLLDFHGVATEAELQLPVERLQSALGTDLSQMAMTDYVLRDFSASLKDGRRFRIEVIDAPHLSKVDGAPNIVTRLRLIPPDGAGATQFDLRADWHTSTFVNDPQLLAVFRGSDSTVSIDRGNGNWWHGFGSVFKLGMRHIAEGADHLLFLLALLLPAPLVTAFTIGHSITPAVGAMNLLHVPGRLIEVFIAVSILCFRNTCIASDPSGQGSGHHGLLRSGARPGLRHHAV